MRGDKQVSEINRSSGVLTIKIMEGDVMTGRVACLMFGKLANEDLSLSSPLSSEHLFSRPLISGDHPPVPPLCGILLEHRAHVGILPHQRALYARKVWKDTNAQTHASYYMITYISS